jgi:hypothetical protein
MSLGARYSRYPDQTHPIPYNPILPMSLDARYSRYPDQTHHTPFAPIFRVGQNRIFTPYMTVYLVFPCKKYRIYTVHIWFWPPLAILPHESHCMLFMLS